MQNGRGNVIEWAIDFIDKSMMPEEDAKIIASYVIGCSGLIVEIGTWRGNTTEMMACLTNFPIVTIDPFESFRDRSKKWPTGVGSFKLASERLVKYSNVEILIGKSKDYVGLIKNIDLLFIDGDHSLKGTLNDLQWIKYAKHVLIHDIHYPNVRKALDGHEWDKLTDTLGVVYE